MKTVVIEGQHRSDMGRKASRDLRSQGNVPAVIYGGKETINFYAPILSFRDIVYTPDFMLAEIQINGEKHDCILKDLQFDPVTDQLTHVDFQELVEDRKIMAEIPLKFEGQPKGVLDGGRFISKMRRLTVRTLPKYLQENIIVNIASLELNGNIRVEDVHIDNWEIMNAPRQPICSVAPTRALKQAATVAAKAGDTAAAAPAADAKAAE